MSDANTLADAAYKDLVEADSVTISKAEYQQLLDDSNFLNKLYAHGVDNWSGFDDAVDDFEEDE